MAHFRATIKGTRGKASRLGSKAGGLYVTVDGWNSGVNIRAYHDEETGEDVFEIASSGGSNGAEKARIVLDCEYRNFVPTPRGLATCIDAEVRAKA